MNIKRLIINIILVCSTLAISAQPLTNLSNIPGYVNPEGTGTCFDFMGAVDFTSSYRFITSYTGLIPPSDWAGGKLNPDSETIVGFSIPYVADLNGDGYPEIITMGQGISQGGVYGYFQYVEIFNGQTGKKIARLPLLRANGSTAGYFDLGGGYHVSPSIAALVDSDRDGVVEIILALPRTGNAELNSRVVSYNIVPSGTGNNTTYTLQYRAAAAEKYIRNVQAGTNGNSEYQKPTPQIADFNGDGKPEVLVYNKIYDASTLELLVEMETIATDSSSPSEAFMGTNERAQGGEAYRDRYVSAPYIYDINLDGIYDVIAGGKVYLMKNGASGKPELDRIIRMPGVDDGYTGVADINGDGVADIVVVNRSARTATSDVQISVWNPNFDANGQSESPALIAPVLNVKTESGGTDGLQGTNSYVYIGDIDGRVQTVNGKEYRLPEIAVLTRRVNVSQFPRHSNISNISEANGGIPTTYNWNTPRPSTTTRSTPQGCLFAVTYDAQKNNLGGSFILEHYDMSTNTGFTMFDFDNDGMQEICYRDEGSLRIIKPLEPFIRGNYVNRVGDGGSTNQGNDIARPDLILFSKKVESFTGFEYPVIADIDNDASAEMIVVGHQNGFTSYGYLYALGNGSGDKFAPALSVWNQFAYDPFKINEDLTTPIGPAPNRFSKDYYFTKVIRDKDGKITSRIPNYNPFNGTLIQSPKIQINDGEIEPLIYLTEAYFVKVGESDGDLRRPVIESIGGKPHIKVWIGNRETAKTDISQNTPIAIYKDEVSKTLYKKVTLSQLGVMSPIKAGEEIQVSIEVDDFYGFYVLRLADDSKYDTNNQITEWKWGINDPNIQDDDFCIGSASRAYRDCNWADQEIKVAKLALIDDTYTIQEFTTVVDAKIFNNDILPEDFIGGFDGPNPLIKIHTQPKSGIVTASGSIDNVNETNTVKLSYQHTGLEVLTDGIDKFTYEITYTDKTISPNRTVTRTADVYIYILQNTGGGFTACKGESYTVRPKQLPEGTTFYWYEEDGTQIGEDPIEERVINNISAKMSFKVKPIIPTSNATYGRINFPIGDITVQVIDPGATLQWTGTVNTVWLNPLNWQEKETGAMLYNPVACINVEIPKVSTNYPILTELSEANNISFFDRSMLKNVHLLECSSVNWEFKAKTEETNKWLSMAAPLSNMYSGDYIVLDSEGNQVHKSAYMLFYQGKDPDREVLVENGTMTRPFGKVGVPISLNSPFFLYIDANYLDPLDAKYNFPTGKTSFVYRKNNIKGAPIREEQSQENIARGVDNKEQFSLFNESGFNKVDGSFTMSYQTGGILYVANPYPAMLNIDAFVLANSDVLEPVYKIWDGNGDGKGNFIEIKRYGYSAPTLAIKSDAIFDNAIVGGTTMLAPFQGFFVKLKNGVQVPIELKFQQDQTSVETIDYTY